LVLAAFEAFGFAKVGALSAGDAALVTAGAAVADGVLGALALGADKGATAAGFVAGAVTVADGGVKALALGAAVLGFAAVGAVAAGVAAVAGFAVADAAAGAFPPSPKLVELWQLPQSAVVLG
jgi:hypothetical protein